MAQSSSTSVVAPTPGILKLAAPLVFSFWLRATFSLVDRIYAGALDSLEDASQAAIGLATPIEFLMIACWVGASNGITARLSAAMGARQGEKVAQLVRAGIAVSSVLAVLFLGLALVLWFAPELIAPSSDPDVVRQFQIYASVVVGGSAFTMFWSILPDSIVKAHQDTVTTMWAGVLSSVLNVVLNTLFVFVFGWGIFGIALSTVIGRLGGLVYAWRKAAQHERRRRAEESDAVPGRYQSAMRAVLAIALPSGLTYVLLSVESGAINEVLKRGADATAALAAWSVFDALLRFFSMPAIAVGVAMLPLVARWRAAGRIGAVAAEVRRALFAIALYTAVLVAPISLVAPHFLADLFVDDPVALGWAAAGLAWLPAAALFAGATFALRPIFDAIDRARLGLVVSTTRSLALVVPLTLLGGHFAPRLELAGMNGYFAGYACACGATCILMLLVLVATRPFKDAPNTAR